MISKHFLGKFIVSVLLLCFLFSGLTYAQRVTGKIAGTVTDEDGAPLPGVTVEISSPYLLGGVHSQLTSASGVYRFLNLAPGTYKIVFKLEGFQTVENSGLKVLVGSTVTEDVTLRQTTLEEAITVTAESPVVDVTKSSVSTNYDTTQLEKLPFARSTYFDMVNQTPGFATMHGEASSRFTAYGSNSEENAMYLDGVDQSNPEIGTSWLWNMPDLFQEVEISGIGVGAEYGNFSGAVVNVVTKSGGNKFSGSASYYGQYDKLSDDNNPDPTQWESYHRDQFYDIAFTLGGPVVKDKVWFFGAFNKVYDSMSDFQDDPQFPSKYRGDEQFFKLSAQIAPAHKLVLFGNRQYGYYPGSPDPWTMPESVAAETDIVYAWNALYTWIISNDAFFELKYSGWWSPNDYMPAFPDQGGNIDKPVHYDWATGVLSNSVWWPWEYIVSRHQLNASVSYFAEDFLAGDHDFKVGVQFNRGYSEAWGGYSGGKIYWDWYGDPYLLYETNINRYGGIVHNIGTFVDDSWKVTDRLTLNWGLRFDHHDADIPSFPIMDLWTETSENGKSVDDVIVWNSFSPRIGFAYQLTADQKTLLKGSFGRYYNYPYINLFEWPGPNAPDWYFYWWDGSQWILYDYAAGEATYTVDPDLKNPYSDQFSVSLERELSANLSIGATFIYKNNKDAIGYEDWGATYEQVQRVSPDSGQTYTVWNQVSGMETNDIYLTNPEGWGQTYKGLILQLNKRFSNNWMLNTSVTWQEAEGLNLTSYATGGYSSSQALPYYTGQFGADPNDLINAKGPLNLDKRWLFKLSAGYNFPWDILVSVNYTMNTGRPYHTFVRIYDLNQVAGFKRIQGEPKGEKRFETMHKVDVRLQKTFTLYNALKLHTFVDIFNALNDDTVTRFRSYDVWRTNYMIPSWIPYPRRAQVGIKLEF